MKLRIGTGADLMLDIAFSLVLLECVREDNITMRFLIFFALFLAAFALKSKGRIRLPKLNVLFAVGGAILAYGLFMVRTGRVLYPDVSSEMVRRLAISYAAMLVIQTYITRYRRSEQLIRLVIIVCAVFMVYVVGMSLPTIFSERLGYAAGFNPNSVAFFSGCTSAFMYYQYCRTKKKGYLLLMGFALLCIFLTGSRKGLVIFAAPILLSDYALTKGWKKAGKVLGLLAAACVAYLLLMVIPFLYDTIGYRVEGLVLLLLGEETQDTSLISRNALAGRAIAMILEEPWTGYGLNAFRYHDRTGLYSHNNYLELLFSGGIPLMLVYYVTHVWIAIKAMRLLKTNCNKRLVATVLALEISFMLNDVGMVAYYSKYVMIMQLMLSAILDEEKRKGSIRRVRRA